MWCRWVTIADVKALCEVCLSEAYSNEVHTREMMFGLRHEFSYNQCLDCGVMSLKDVPTDMSQYYPKDYYSYKIPGNGQNPLRRYLRRKRLAHQYATRNFIGTLLKARPAHSKYAWWFQILGLKEGESLLDIGCGRGEMLYELTQIGFYPLTGIDPYIDGDFSIGSKVNVFKQDIYSHQGSYDYITMEHSFEHMARPRDVMKEIQRLLKPRGKAMIRIPIADCRAMSMYGPNWVQIDAPRHLFIHTRKSMAILAHQAGLEIFETCFDSVPFQFRSSELYARDVPLIDHETKTYFSEAEEHEFIRLTSEVNNAGEGDQAAFFLRRSTDAP